MVAQSVLGTGVVAVLESEGGEFAERLRIGICFFNLDSTGR